MRSSIRFRPLALAACLTAAFLLFFTSGILSGAAGMRSIDGDAPSARKHPPNTAPDTGAQSDGQLRSRERKEVIREASPSLAYREAQGTRAYSPSPVARSSNLGSINAALLTASMPSMRPPRRLKSGRFAYVGAIRSSAGHTTDDSYFRQPIKVMRS